MTNTLEAINSRITEAEEQIQDLVDRMVEITAAEQNIEKWIKINKDSLKYLWDKVKCTNICIIWIPEGEERNKRPEIKFEEIVAKNFPTTKKEIGNQVQQAQWVSGRINPRRNTTRHIVAKTTKIKDKILKETREKWQIYEGTPIRLSADFSTETLQARRNGVIYLKWWKGRTYNQE